MTDQDSRALSLTSWTWASALPRGSILLAAQRLRAVPVAVAVLATLLLVTTLLLPAGGFYVGDQGVKLLQIDALSRTGSLALGSSAEPASVFRPEFSPFRIFARVGDSFQTLYSPAYSSVVLPFYKLLGLHGVVIPSLLGTVLAACSAALIASRLKARHPQVVVLVVGFATPLFFYANVLWEHALATGLATLALALHLSGKSFIAGLALGLAGTFRSEMYVLVPAIVVAHVLSFGIKGSTRPLALLVCGAAIASAPFFFYNQSVYGSMSGGHIEANTNVKPTIEETAHHLLPNLAKQAGEYLLPLGIRKWLVGLSIVALVALGLRLVRRSPLPALWLFYLLVVGVGTVHIARGGVAAQSVTDAFPFCFAALAGLPLIRREPPVRFLWLAVSLYLLGALLFVPTGPWTAGGWGPRYMLVIYPLLAVLAWLGFERARQAPERLVLAVLLTFSFALQIVGIQKLYGEQARWSTLNAELTALEPSVVATSVWWLPQVTTATAQQVRWFGVLDDSDLSHVASTSDHFWWVWTPEIWPGRFTAETAYLKGAAPLPTGDYMPLAVRKLSTHDLEAVLYTVDRTGRNLPADVQGETP